MTDVLLIYPTYSYTRKNPPLGLAYLASYLEKSNYSVKILDVSAQHLTEADLENEIAAASPKMVGISFMTNQWREALATAQLIKRVNPSILVVTGGPHASALPDEALADQSIDFVVIGEGENTLVDLADKFIRNKDIRLAEINGIAYREGERVVISAPRPFIENLDSIPFPAWHLLAVEKYSVSPLGMEKEIVLPIISSRGCPNQCIFCDSHTIFGRCFRGRSAKNIFAEILFLKNNYHITQFDFVDDTITIDKGRVTELCNLIIGSDLNVKWMCNARVNTVDINLLQLMKMAGCIRIDLGVESGDENVLRSIKKGITIEQIKNAHKLVHAAGIVSNSFVMVGNLNEDFESVKKTVRLVQEIAEDISIAIATPFPGTELYKLAKANNWLRITDWSKYVTSPTYLPGYRPIMVTDKMGEADIMKAFYYVQSKSVRKRFAVRYGKHFYFNPRFYVAAPFKIHNAKELLHKIKIGWRLLISMFKQ
jgi:radical SAM superfamily enzyme YgiQ (UPF0313 family)